MLAMFWRKPRICEIAPEVVRSIAAQLKASAFCEQRPSRMPASIDWMAPSTLMLK